MHAPRHVVMSNDEKRDSSGCTLLLIVEHGGERKQTWNPH